MGSILMNLFLKVSLGNGHKVTVGLSDGFYIDEPISKGKVREWSQSNCGLVRWVLY